MTNEYGNELLHRVLLSAMKDVDHICRQHGLRYYLYAGTLLGAMNHHGFIPWDDDVDIVMFPDDFRTLCRVIEAEYADRYSMMTFENTADWFSKMNKLRVKGTLFRDGNGGEMPVFVDINVLHSLPDGKFRRMLQRRQIELINLALGVLSGAVTAVSWKSKCTFGLLSKMGKARLGKRLDRILTRYDHRATECVGIMCNTLTCNPYTGVAGYDTDVTKRSWHEEPVYVPFEDTQFMTIGQPREYLTHQYGPHWAEPYPKEKRITKHGVKDHMIEPWVMERLSQ